MKHIMNFLILKNRIILFLIISGIISNASCLSQTENEPLNMFPGNTLKLSNNYQKRNCYYNLKLKDSTNTDITGKTDDCDIFLTNRSALKNVSLVALKGSFLVVDKEGIKKELNVQNINKIKFSSGSGFWLGAAIGTGVSLVGWTLIGLAFGGEVSVYGITIGLIYALPSGLVGGLIGLIFDRDDELYDIAGGNPKAKLKRLRYIIDKHTPGNYWQQ